MARKSVFDFDERHIQAVAELTNNTGFLQKATFGLIKAIFQTSLDFHCMDYPIMSTSYYDEYCTLYSEGLIAVKNWNFITYNILKAKEFLIKFTDFETTDNKIIVQIRNLIIEDFIEFVHFYKIIDRFKNYMEQNPQEFKKSIKSILK